MVGRIYGEAYRPVEKAAPRRPCSAKGQGARRYLNDVDVYVHMCVHVYTDGTAGRPGTYGTAVPVPSPSRAPTGRAHVRVWERV